MGIGTRARQKALEHFAKSEFLTGVSSRVDIDNLPLLKGNGELGFEIKEKYWDKDSKKEPTLFANCRGTENRVPV